MSQPYIVLGPPPPPPGPGPSGDFDPFQPPPPPDLFSCGRFNPPPLPSHNNCSNLTFRAQPSSYNRTSVGGQPPCASNLFGSQTAVLTRQKENVVPKDDVAIQTDDTIYELPE